MNSTSVIASIELFSNNSSNCVLSVGGEIFVSIELYRKVSTKAFLDANIDHLNKEDIPIDGVSFAKINFS